MATVRCPKCLKTWESPVIYATFFGRNYETCADCWRARYEKGIDGFAREITGDGETPSKSRSSEF